MISGIVGSKRTNYPEIAKKAPDGNKPVSREKRFSRWVIKIPKGLNKLAINGP